MINKQFEEKMELRFVNGSNQKKKIIESDYMEDIIDMIIDFFETHNRFPHVMYLEHENDNICVSFIGTCEHFEILHVDEDGKCELADWVNRYNN